MFTDRNPGHVKQSGHKQHEGFRVSSWNVASSSHWSDVDFARITRKLDADDWDVLCLQELKDSRQKLAVGLHAQLYSFESSTTCINHNVVLTRRKVIDHVQWVPATTGINGPFEAVQVVTIEVDGHPVSIYNCHLPIEQVGIAQRMAILDEILADADNRPSPLVLCGDLNTTIPKAGWRRNLVRAVHRVPLSTLRLDGTDYHGDERHLCHDKLRSAGFTEAFPLSQATWAFPHTKQEFFNLKLDWLAVRGLDIAASHFEDYVSDHRRLNARLLVA